MDNVKQLQKDIRGSLNDFHTHDEERELCREIHRYRAAVLSHAFSIAGISRYVHRRLSHMVAAGRSIKLLSTDSGTVSDEVRQTISQVGDLLNENDVLILLAGSKRLGEHAPDRPRLALERLKKNKAQIIRLLHTLSIRPSLVINAYTKYSRRLETMSNKEKCVRTHCGLAELLYRQRSIDNIIPEIAKRTDALVLNNVGLVFSSVTRYPRKYHAELVTAGYLGMDEAIQRFDPDWGTRFCTYATWWIRQRIRNAYRNEYRVIEISEWMESDVRKHQESRRQLRHEYGRKLSPEEERQETDQNCTNDSRNWRMFTRLPSAQIARSKALTDPRASHFSMFWKAKGHLKPLPRLLRRIKSSEMLCDT